MGTRVAAAHFSDKTFAGVPQLLEDLQKLADDHESADIVFLIGREEAPVYAHRIILMTRLVLKSRKRTEINNDRPMIFLGTAITMAKSLTTKSDRNIPAVNGLLQTADLQTIT